MSIRERFVLGITLLLAIGFYFSVDYIVDDIELRYRESTEEPLVDMARVLASLAAETVSDGRVDVNLFRNSFRRVQTQKFSARIFDLEKTHVDLHVYITDHSGTVIFDSDNGREEGQDFSQWRDVHRTLAGLYGARSSDYYRDRGIKILYIASPILVDGDLIGVLSVGKPTYSANQFTLAAQRKLVQAAAFVCLALIAAGFLFSLWVTGPIQKLTEYARAVRDGKRVKRPELKSSELAEFGIAFEEMRNALEGKRYVENYVKTLTHEIKSPLSAIRGAAELLGEEIPEQQRGLFLQNIRLESERIHQIVENLLLLASLEHRDEIDLSGSVPVDELFREVERSLNPLLSAKSVSLAKTGQVACRIQGDSFLLRQALLNLVQNAIEFSPEGERIEVTVTVSGEAVEIDIRDHGPGIPEFARGRIFERFYSLKRPDSGKKSSGLGLSLVKEIVDLHQASVCVETHPDGGTFARLVFPN
jgi:two-component system, OmpR family, sensor histidine kinase CreC